MSARPETGPDMFVRAIRREWLRVLVGVLGIYAVLLASSARPGLAAIGIVGGLMVVAAPWVGRRSTAAGVVLLVVGTLPFAALAWWSIIVPFVAVLALAIGLSVLLRNSGRSGDPVPAPSP